MQELIKCRFCGGDNLFVKDDLDFIKLEIDCPDCDATVYWGVGYDEEEMTELYNKSDHVHNDVKKV